MATQKIADPRLDEEKLPVPPGWLRVHCDRGTYYWHSATEHSQWDFPKEHPFAGKAASLRANYENVAPGKPPTPPRGLKPKRTGYVNLDYSSGEMMLLLEETKKSEEKKHVASKTPSPPPKEVIYDTPAKEEEEEEEEEKESVVSVEKTKSPTPTPNPTKEVIYDMPPKEEETVVYSTPKKTSATSESSYDHLPSTPKGESLYDRPPSKEQESQYDRPSPLKVDASHYDSPKGKKSSGEVLYDVPSDAMAKNPEAIAKTRSPKPKPRPRQSSAKPSVSGGGGGGKSAPVIPPPYQGKSKKEPPKKPSRRSLSPEFVASLSSSPSPVPSPQPGRANPYDRIELATTTTTSSASVETQDTGYDHLGKEASPQYDHIAPLRDSSGSPAPSAAVAAAAAVTKNQYDHLPRKSASVDDDDDDRRYAHLSSPPASATKKTAPGQYDRLMSTDDDDKREDLERLRQAREERVRRHNYEEIVMNEEDELVWDDTPIVIAYQELKKPPPPAAPSTKDDDDDDNLYSQVDVRKKSKEEKLPDGWEIVRDPDKTEAYYWHVPSGKTQWDKPTASDENRAELSPPPVPMKTDEARVLIEAVPSSVVEEEREVGVMDEILKADPKFTSLNIGGSSPGIRRQMWDSSVDGVRSFQAFNLGWVELEESQLLPSKSQMTINQAIRFITGVDRQENDEWNPASGKLTEKSQSLYLQLHGIMLKIITADTKNVVMTQSITGIRIFGSGKENPSHFAFVARDRVTQKHRCHVFLCSALGKTVAGALGDVCSQVIRERQDRKRVESGHVQRKLTKLDEGVAMPTQQEKKTFVATYLGRTDVPQGSGIEVVRNAINKLRLCNSSQWQEVIVEVMPTNVKIIDQKTQDVVHEHRVSLMSFLGLGQDKRYCGYVLSPSRDIHWCHAFASEINSGPMTVALKAACNARYQSVVESHQGMAPQRGTTPQRAETVKPVSSKTAAAEAKTAKGALKSFFGRFSRIRKPDDTLPDVSTYLHYMGSETIKTSTSQLDIKDPLRRLSATSLNAISCEMVVSSINITLHDSQKRSFSKKLFPLSSIIHCEKAEGDVFGFITNKDRVYVCHAFRKLGKCEIGSVFDAIQSRRSSSV
ncbi:amyloid beta precursor protein binding family B member 2-like [Oscarella lobularis]|uniref:amyloid beta precursor protein binding family B member 2-like n=1 Tax=Oscarella lobularis TaxID=121494 RepID=UPI003313708C